MIAFSIRLPYVLAILVGVLLLWWLIRRIGVPSPPQQMEQRMRRDAATDFLRAWSQAAFMLVTRDCDYGFIPEGQARKLLRHWWDVHGPREHRAAMERLGASGRTDNAWDLLRFILVARMGVGAGYLGADACWELVRPVALRLQRAYRGWNELGQAYVQARRQWRGFPLDGSEDDAEMRRIVENIAELRHGMWTRIDYHGDLREAKA